MAAYMDKIIQQTQTMVERIRDHDRNTLYLDEPSLGACPACGGEVKENTLAYQCEHNEGRDKGCAFLEGHLGRWFDRTTASRFVRELVELDDLHGFFTGRRGYDTSVVLAKDGKVASRRRRWWCKRRR